MHAFIISMFTSMMKHNKDDRPCQIGDLSLGIVEVLQQPHRAVPPFSWTAS